MSERSLDLSFDCDDVLVETVSKVIKHYNETYDANVEIAKYYGGPEDWGVSDYNIANNRIKKYLKEYGHTELIVPYPEAVIGVKALVSMGHKAHIVTARSDFMIPVTEAMVETFFPDCFDEIIHTNGYDLNPRTKGSVCAELKVDAHIDDHIEHCNSVLDHGVEHALLLSRDWNLHEDLRPGITRCKDWRKIVRGITRIAQY